MTTPNYSFPYPDGDDAPNGFGQIQALAEAVDDQLALTDAAVALLDTRAEVLALLFGAAVTVSDTETALGNFTLATGSYTETMTTSNTPCSFTFVAPPSGAVLIFNSSWVDNSSSVARSFVGYVVREGAVIGSGTVVQAAADSRAVHNLSDADMSAGRTNLLTGLTPGDTYNIRQAFRVTSGTGESQNRHLVVTPLAA